MTGFGVSDELRKLLANAFAGGMEASSGMKSVSIKKMSYTDLREYIDKEGRDPYHVGEPEIVAIWPLPLSMVKDRIHTSASIPPPSSPAEKLRSFMGDVSWGEEKMSKTMYDPTADTWHTRTVGSGSHYVGGGGGSGGVGSTARIIGAEEWHTVEEYDDMSREDREREMSRIADLIRKRIDESVLERVSESTGLVGHKLAEHQNEHIIARREFVEAMSSHKDKVMSDAQRALLVAKKKEMSDRINKLAKKHKARK